MNRDFQAGRYRAAEKKLRQAIDLCLAKGCSVPFRARLNRDIGIVYIGMRHIEDGKDEFATALTADPTVAIAPNFNTNAVNKAFLEVKRSLATEGQGGASSAPVPASKSTKTSAQAEPFSETSGESVATFLQNWLTLGYQQDFIVHTATQNVCNAGSRYLCYDANNQNVNFDAGGVSNGNEISASGMRLASGRILLGFERLLSKNIGLGVKLGAVVRGKGLILDQQPAFFNFHAEARFSWYPGSDPFGASTNFRPYLFASAGAAETDSKISIEVIRSNGAIEKYVAWKRAGKGFMSGGFGITFPVSQTTGPFVEMRFLRMFEKPSYAAALMGGWSVGF
jgi:hypothetical protein